MNASLSFRGFVLILMLFPYFAQTQSWDFIKEKNGIKIYTCTPVYSSFKCFKGETVLHATMQEIGRYIGNVKNFNWWDKNIRDLKVIGPGTDAHVRYYFIYDVPWPLSDRDICVDVSISIDSVTGVKTVFAKPLPGVIPEYDDIVRIKNYWQKWTLTPAGSNSVNAVLEGFVDPAGSVPAWLYNMVIVETPLKVMGGIKERLEGPLKDQLNTTN
ncbi:MAG: hypothetical protein EOM90_02860 [Alphaproteobacteria bacterium]|nr:hypothetical protein [Alphaproteobacteria bacterium]